MISKTGLESLFRTIRGVSLSSFLSSALLYILSIFISSIRWRLLLMKEVSLKRLFSLYLLGSFFNNLMPGSIGGDAVKAYYLSKDLDAKIAEKPSGQKTGLLEIPSVHLSVASVFMDRYIGFVSLLIIAIIAYPFGFKYFKGSHIEWILPLIITAFMLGSFVIFILRIGRRLRFVRGFYEYLEYYKGERGLLVKGLILSLILQMIIITSAFMISKGMDMNIPFYLLSLIIPLISVISSIPVSISGLGVREASFAILLTPIGVPYAQAITLSVTWFLSFAAGSLPGLFLYLKRSHD